LFHRSLVSFPTRRSSDLNGITLFPRFSCMGVRPNSPRQTTKVSSNKPLCFKSLIKAVIGWSICLHLSLSPPSIESLLVVPWESQPQSNICTNRTPCSTSRLANKQLLAKEVLPGSVPYILCIC